jgi:hypothetical protein
MRFGKVGKPTREFAFSVGIVAVLKIPFQKAKLLTSRILDRHPEL